MECHSGCIKSINNTITATLKGIPVPIPVYDGSYVFTPSTFSYFLDTEGKKLISNILINEIPYSEELNSAGGLTIKIG